MEYGNDGSILFDPNEVRRMRSQIGDLRAELSASRSECERLREAGGRLLDLSNRAVHKLPACYSTFSSDLLTACREMAAALAAPAGEGVAE